MGTRKSIADALDTRVESTASGIGITCIKGYPAWDRPGVSLPLSTILWEADETLTELTAMGRSVSPMQLTSFNLTVMAETEVELWGYVDAAYDMVDDWETPTIDSRRMTVGIERAERLVPPDDTTEELRYAATVTVTFRYVR